MKLYKVWIPVKDRIEKDKGDYYLSGSVKFKRLNKRF